MRFRFPRSVRSTPPRKEKIMGLFSKHAKIEARTVNFEMAVEQSIAEGVIKEADDLNNVLFARYRLQNLNKLDSIVVYETHSAILMVKGKLLATLDSGEHIIDQYENNKGDTVDIIFFSKTVRIPARFGTPQLSEFADPITNERVAIGANGVFEINVANARKFYLELVGLSNSVDVEKLKERLGFFMSNIIGKEIVKVIVENKIPYDQYVLRKDDFSEPIIMALNDMFVNNYGVRLFDLVMGNIFMPDEFKKKIDDAANNEGVFYCSKCGNKMKAGDKFCSKCGTAPAGVEGVVCPKCGAVHTNDSAFCSKCGQSLK